MAILRRLFSSLSPGSKENIFTIPNAITLMRIGLSPCIGYEIISHHPQSALALVAIAGVSDALDGYIARRFNQKTYLGSALDPMADKILMTSLVVSTCYIGDLSLPLASLIIGRDILLIAGTAYYRYISLSPPRTLSRYFDLALPSAEVQPPLVSKVNTALQLSLMLALITANIYDFNDSEWMVALKYSVGITTVWSGLHYLIYARKLIKFIK